MDKSHSLDWWQFVWHQDLLVLRTLNVVFSGIEPCSIR